MVLAAWMKAVLQLLHLTTTSCSPRRGRACWVGICHGRAGPEPPGRSARLVPPHCLHRAFWPYVLSELWTWRGWDRSVWRREAVCPPVACGKWPKWQVPPDWGGWGRGGGCFSSSSRGCFALADPSKEERARLGTVPTLPARSQLNKKAWELPRSGSLLKCGFCQVTDLEVELATQR